MPKNYIMTTNSWKNGNDDISCRRISRILILKGERFIQSEEKPEYAKF